VLTRLLESHHHTAVEVLDVLLTLRGERIPWIVGCGGRSDVGVVLVVVLYWR
jgi:hypothetical protein